jgi:AAA15 family ATPase/GTPase
VCVQSQQFPKCVAGSDGPIMIDQVNINNFRCFRELEVPDLKKMNLLVGQNSSGKSAFLEAVFLSSSSAAANAAFQLRAIRRMGNLLVQPTDAQTYRGLWEDLFFDFSRDKKVSIKITGNPNSDSRSLSIEYYTSSQGRELPFGKQPPASGVHLEQTNAMPQIEFKWKRSGYPEVISKPRFTNTGMQVDVTDVTYFPSIWYSPGASETPDENAKRFSELDKRGDGKLDLVKTAIFKEFNFIKDVSIQFHAGIPIMFAELKTKPRKMPVALLSDGINRLLGICLSLAYFEGGTVLVDQFEDGFHYKLLPSIWSSIYNLAKEFKVQMFISTHSKECMDALLPTMQGYEDDFCLLRASRTEFGCDIKSLGGKYLESALEQEFEVR